MPATIMLNFGYLAFSTPCMYSLSTISILFTIWPIIAKFSRNIATLILVTIGQIVKKWQQFFEIQVGGGRHLEL